MHSAMCRGAARAARRREYYKKELIISHVTGLRGPRVIHFVTQAKSRRARHRQMVSERVDNG